MHISQWVAVDISLRDWHHTRIEKGENAFNDSARKSYHDILPNAKYFELSKKQHASLFLVVMHRICVPQLILLERVVPRNLKDSN